MLIGEYLHTIDAKGRLNFPAKLRDDIGTAFIVTKGLDGCLFGYSQEEWKKLEEKIKSLPLSKARNLQRFLFASAGEVECDKQGRIIIPPSLREYAKLEKDVAVIGASSRVEFWNKQAWEEQCMDITGEAIETAMDELGF